MRNEGHEGVALDEELRRTFNGLLSGLEQCLSEDLCACGDNLHDRPR